MYKRRNSTNMFSSALTAVLQIVASLLAASGFAVITLLRLFALFAARGSLGDALLSVLAGAGLAGILLYCAIRTLSLLSRCKIITRAMERGYGRLSIKELSRLTGRPQDKLADDIQIMIQRGYFGIPVQYDLYRGELVPGQSEPVLPPEPDPGSDTMLKVVKKRSNMPLVVSALALVLYMMVFPLNSVWKLGGAVVLCLVVLVIVWRFTPTTHHVVEVKRPKQKREPVQTGNKDVDDALKTAMGQLQELQRLDRVITDEKIDLSVQKLVIVAQDILSHLEEHPEKLRQTRQFLSYYLPTTVKLLATYDEFSRQQVKGENVRQSLNKIEGTMQDLVKAFQKELDNLYFDKAIDISTDIDVMQSMLQREGINTVESKE